MANLQVYSRIYVSAKGSLLAEAQKASFTRNTNSQAIQTILKGYSGESPGALMCECDVESAVPQAGIEFDPGDLMATLTPVELGFATDDGKVAVFKGSIIKDSGSHGVGSATQHTFSFRGQFAQFQ